ncbi:MAG TPA: hypothetical protein VHM28_04890 [Anaerolineales bacterium]|nr:hypothetical protein [Anaerolineales bacterium]
MKRLIVGFLVLAVLLLPVRSAHAWNGLSEGRVIVGDNFTLKSGETIDGDLVVIGGATVVEEGAIVKGNVVVIGGSLKLDGQVASDAVVIGGLADLGDNASLKGDLVVYGGSMQRAEGAQIGGQVVTNSPLPAITIPNPSNGTNPPTPPTPHFDINFNPLWQVGGIFLQALGLSALAMLLAVFLHPQMDRVARASVLQPLMTGGIGLLTAVLAPLALLLLGLTLILLPVALVAALALGLAWVFGIAALGLEVGERFTKAIHQTWAPVLSAGAGTFLLMVVVNTINLVPCVGWMVGLLVGLVGFGAVVITLFGTRPYLAPVLSAMASTPQTDSGQQTPPTASA